MLPITAKRAPPRGDPGSGRERQRDGQKERDTEREREMVKGKKDEIKGRRKERGIESGKGAEDL